MVNKSSQQTLTTKQKLLLRKKEAKKIQSAKRARLIIKNLPFAATDENVKEYFEKYGEVSEVNLLKKPDGKLVGCGFVQFSAVQQAAKAKHYTNGKEFLGRNIDVNFVLSKDVYKKAAKGKPDGDKIEIKQEPIDLDLVKKEIDENATDEAVTSGDGNNIDNDDIETSDAENEDEEDTDESEDTDEETDDDDEEEEEIKEEDNNSEIIDVKDRVLPKKEYPRVISNDVQEGKTVFVKNIPFSATNQQFKECMKQFGPVYYALICIDKLTEHSKGTGFVKFVNLEDAEKCLQAGTELKLEDNILDCHKAMSRDDVTKRSSMEKGEKNRDSRNLYLIKEGVILAGTKAAQGVSATDMAKRLQLEQYKTQVLRNLNMFVSKYRLIIHNIPPTWNDSKLKALFQKHAGSKAVIKEAKIMRNLRDVDANGVGKSKEYGFVSFSTHENALKALRSLNNNPQIFGPNKRPIVAFSIENRVMVKAREKRLERSRINNPKCKDFVPKKEEQKRGKNGMQGEDTRKRKLIDESTESFAGVAAKPGIKKMRSRYKLQTQAQLHREQLGKEKRKAKLRKKPLKEREKDFTKQPRQKINHKSETDSFNKLVSSYKKKLYDANLDVKKNKWYES